MSVHNHESKGKADTLPDSKEESYADPKEDVNPYFSKEDIEKYNNENALDDIWDLDGKNNSTNLEADKDFIQGDPTDFLDAVIGFHEPGREHNTKKVEEKKEKTKEDSKPTKKKKKKGKKGKKVNINRKFRNMDDGYSNYKYSEYDDMFMLFFL